MSHTMSIVRKELRTYFQSAVALVFLGIFLGATVFTFFWIEKFFARGLADVRPMFEWLPILLILLVSALTMRLWSEEQKTGTIEILLTLPIRPRELVLGKFFSGLALILMALALTLPIPLTVSMMGDLDWGPVLGGYLAASLLAGAYLSIGLCVSSSTDNQLLALFGTSLVCGAFYLIGSDSLVEGLSVERAELLRSFGMGARFESVARGVLDLSDLAYYLGFIATFLTLNTLLVGKKRWSKGPRAVKVRSSASVALALVAANALAFNLLVSRLEGLRIDLTEDGLYSLSAPTKDLLSSLDEPLLVRAYVSSSVHPKIDPLVPELFDLLREYEEAGKGMVRLELVDPDSEDELQQEAEEDYDIVPDQFEITTRNKQALVNAYFRVLVEHGDQHEVLGFQELLHIMPLGVGDVEVKLGNVEYELTKAIRKTMQGFQSLESVYASLGSEVEATLLTSPTLPRELDTAVEAIESALASLREESHGQLSFERELVDSEEQQRRLAARYGLEPFAALRPGPNGMEIQSFYFHLLLRVGDDAVVINPPEDSSEATIKELVEAALRQSQPGFIRTVGLVLPKPSSDIPPQMRMQLGHRQPPAPQRFEGLRALLAQSYRVKDVDLGKDIDAGVDLLLLAGPEGLGPDELLRIDQFLMRGGSVVALAGQHRLDLDSPTLASERVDSGLSELLKSYGLEIGKELVLEQEGGVFATIDPRRRQIEAKPAAQLVEVERRGLGKHLATSSLAGLSALHASPLRFEAQDDGSELDSSVLVSASSSAWTAPSPTSPPPAADHRSGKQVLAMAVTGVFRSPYAETDPNELSHADASKMERGGDEPDSATASDKGETQPDETKLRRRLARSPADTRLVVVGSSDMFADTPLQILRDLSRAGGSTLYRNNLPFLLNVVDWALEDTSLLGIRARFTGSRILDVDTEEHEEWEQANYGISFALLLLLGGFTLIRRRTLRPMELCPREDAVSHGESK